MKNCYLSQIFEIHTLFKLSTSSKWALRAFFLTFIFLIHHDFLSAQTTYTWSGGPSGAWNVASNWSPTRSVLDPNDLMVVNTGGAVTITTVPTEQVSRLVVSGSTNLTLQGAAAVTLTIRNGAAANDLEIQNGSSLTLGTNVSLTMAPGTHAQINTGGSLTISSGRTFTLANNLGTTANVDGSLNIDGILSIGAAASLTVNGTVTNTPNSGVITSSAANTIFSATGIYRHQRAGGNFIVATWHPDSEVFVEIPSAGSASIAQANGQTFGRFTWNSPSMSNTQSLGLSGTTNFNTSFEILSTGTGIMSFAAAAATVNINTDLNIGGNSTVHMNSGGAVITTINLTGNLDIASTATFARGSATSLQVLSFTNTSSPQFLNNSGTSFNPNGININVITGAEVNFTNSISGYNSGTFTVNGRLNMGSHILSGTGGLFTLANATTAFLSIGHPQGISTTGATGNVQVTGTRTFGANANYIYNGNSAQVTGNGLPAAINAASQLTIDNPVSVELQVSPTINGTLNMNQGRLILGNFNLTFVAATNFIGAPFSATKMIVANGTGQLLVPFTAGANPPFLFPIGDGSGNYTPCTIEFAANSTARTLGVRVSNTVHPFNNAATPHLTRHWLFTNSATGTATVNASFTYVPADVVGVEANLRFNKFSSVTGNWSENASTTLASNTFSVNNETNFINPGSATAFDITARANSGLFYRSTGNGNWNALATWETGPTSTGPWTAATVIPNNTNSDGIEIRSGHNVTVNVTTSADEITINGTLTIASGITLTIPAGGTFGAVVNGTVINGNAATIGTITPTGGLVFNAGSFYEHARPAGTIPAATWDDNSTCLVSGATGTVPAGLNPTGGFGNFTWNCAGQTTTLVTGTMTCRGNFRIENTNNQVLSLIGGTASGVLNVNGDFEMIAGLYYAKTGTTGTATLNVAGKFDMQGGTFSFAQNASSGSGVLNLSGNLELMGGTLDMSLSTSTGIGTINLLGNYIQNGGTFTSTGTTTGISVLNLNGIATQYNYISGTINNTRINYAVNAASAVVTLNADIALSPSRSFTVTANGTLLCQNFVISGGSANTFSIAAGSTLGIGSPDGITTAGNPTGNIQTTTRTFLTTSNYIYNGTSAQVTGNALPTTVNSLTIDNIAGVTLTNSITSITSALNLNNGLLRLGASNNLSITLGNNAVVNGTPSATTMVVADGSGQFVKGFVAGFAGSFTYPIGDASGPSNTVEYSPVTINFAAAPAMAAQNIGVRVVDDVAPSLGTPADFLSRHWVFTGGGAASFDLSFQYPSADINGTESNLRISRFLSGNWLSSPSAASGNVLSNTTTLTNISTPLNTTTIYTGRESNQLYYRSVASGNWTDVNTWETDTDPNFSSPTSPAAAAPTFTNSVTTTIAAGDEVVIDGAAINNYTPVLYVYGTLINQTSGTVVPNTNGSNFFYAGSEYRHDRDGGPVMNATWDAASLLNITGITSNTTGAALSNIGGAGKQYGKFRYNCSGQTAANVNFAMNGTTFNGTFEITNTGVGSNAVSFGSGALTNITIRDTLKITGGILNLNNAGSSVTNVSLFGDYFQTGGTFQRGASTGVQTLQFFGDNVTNKTYVQSGGTANFAGINPSVQPGGVLTLESNITIPSGNTFTLNTNGQLYMQDRIISGAGAFVMVSAANTLTTLGIGHPQGISTLAGTGNIQTATRTIAAGHRGHFIYNGTTDQVTGNLLPLAPASEGGITIDNPTTVTLTNNITGMGSRGLTINQGTLNMASNSITLPTSLNLNSGRIIINNGNLTLSNTNNLTALTGGPFDENTMIVINGTGQLIKNFTSGAQAEFVYPVGEINGTPEYTPVSIEFTALTTGKNVGVRVIQAMQPNELASNPAYLNRYWAFTTNNTTANTAIMRMQYKDADVVGNEADLRLAQFFNGTWSELNSTVDVTNNILTTTAINPLLPLVVVSTPTADYTGRSNIPLHYRTVASGNWNNLAIWEVSSDPAFISPAPVPATAIPNHLNSNLIWVRNGHNVTMNVNTTADDLLVDGTLTIASGVIFTLANGPAAPDMTVNGTVINQSVATHVYTGTLVYNSGSTYRHAANGGVVPAPTQVTYDAASTFEVTGITNGTAITNMGVNGQTYGNFTWNCASQSTAVFSLAFAATVTINGNFRVQNTNGQAIAIHSGTASTTVVNGDLLIQAGNLIMNNGGTAVTTLNLFGNYNQTGGSFQTGASTGIQLFNMNGTNRTYSQTGGTVNNVRTNYAVNLAGADVTFNSPLTLDASRSFTIAAGATARLGANINFANAGGMTVNGTLMCGPNLVTNTTGATTFTLASGGTLGIGSPDGITTTGAIGNIQVSGTRAYNTAANYIYTGTTAQVTGNGLPATVNTLTIDNTAGGNNGVTLTNNVAVTTALNLNQGLLLLDNFNLTLSNTNNSLAIGGNTPDVNNMVVTNGTGQLIKTYANNAASFTSFTFPIGDITGTREYSPVVLTTSVNSGNTIGVRVINSAHPDVAPSSNYLNRHWAFTTNIATYTYTADFHFTAADVVGTLANINGALRNNTVPAWWGYSSTNSGNILSITTAPLNQVSAPLNNNQWTGRETVNTFFYRSVAWGNWSDPATWEISTDNLSNWVPATTFPNADNSLGILIRNNHRVTLDVNVDVDQLSFDATDNSTLIINPGVTMTVKDGPGNDFSLTTNARMIVNGTIINEGQIFGSSVITTVFNANALYVHTTDGGVVPQATWDISSICRLTGIVVNNPVGGLGAPTGGYGTVEYNCPSQTADIVLGFGNNVIVKGDFNLLSTGTGRLVFSSTAINVNINGDFNLSDGTFGMIGYASGTGASTLNLTGSYNQSGGSFVPILGTGTGVQAMNFVAGPNRTYNVSGGTFSTDALMNFTVNVNAELTLNTGIDLGSPSAVRSFTNNGILWLGTNLIEGGPNTTFTNANATTATLGIGHPQGIALAADGAVGNIQTANRIYGALANYVFNGTTAQITGSGLHNAIPGTNTCTNLTINNAAGVTMNRLGGISLNIGVSGTLVLTNGDFNIGGSAGNINTLALNGSSIAPLASMSLQSGIFSNLWFGPGTGNNNPNLYIPSSINELNELRLNINSANTVEQTSSVELHGSPTGLTLTSGRLIMQGSSNLTVLSTATNGIVGGGVNNMVVTNGTGYLRRAIPGGIAANTDYIFPIGDITGTAEYSPANLRFTSSSATPAFRLIGANVVDDQHPQDGTSTDHLTRYWRFTDSEAGNGTYSYTGIGTGNVNLLSGVAADVVGTYGNIRVNRWDGTAWTQYNNTATTPNLSFLVQNETTAPLHNGEFTGRVNAAQPYVWQPTSGSHDFQDANNWLPTRVSPQPSDILLFNNGGTSTAINVPTQTTAQVAVTNNTNITFEAATVPAGAKTFTINGPANSTNFTVANGSSFTMGGTIQLTLTMTGATNQAADISGIFNLDDNGSQQHTLITSGVTSNVFTVSGTLNNNGGTITSAAASNLVFTAGGTYNHNRNGGNIPNSVAAPLATWNNTSNCNITGITTTNPATFQGTFGNLTWNNAGQTSATGAITAAITVNGNLSVNNGVLWDNGLIITGNAAGTFAVANGATYRTTRTTTLPLLPSFTGTNVSLAPNSTVLFAGTTAHNIPNNPTNVGTMTNYGIIALEGAVAKTLTTDINVQGITINTSGATLSDGGFVITGPGAGSGTFNMVNGAIFTTTNTNANPMPIFQTYTFGPTSIVNFNALSSNQDILNIPAPGYGAVNVIANGGVKSLMGQTFAQGTVTINGIGGNTTLNLNGHNLRLAGATPISVVAGAVLTANSAGSTITLEGTASQTLTIAGTITGGVINQLTAANPVANVIGTVPAVFTFNDITVNSGALLNMNGRTINLNGLLTNNGEINGSAAGSVFALTGSTMQNFNIGNYTSNTLGGLIVNNTAGATLTAPLNVTTLTLINGLLTTTNTNLITVLGTAVANVVGGSTTSYVHGPIARTLPVNLTAAGTYNWPVGKAEYQLFQLINPTTANTAGNVVIKVEVFDAPTGGTAGLGVSSLLTDHRWEALIINNAANLTSAGRTALTENGLTNLVHHIVRSTTATGTYHLFGSSYATPVLSMNVVPDNLLGYYMIANNGGTISGPITVGTGGMVPSITNGGGLFDVINNSILSGNVTASIISDLVNESGLIALNEWTESPAASNFTVRIQPSSATSLLITNNANLAIGIPLIPINGADRLTIDGQHSNDGNRWLTFRHTNSTAGNTGATIRFLNDAVNNTLQNLILENNNTNTGRGVVEFTTGNNANNSVLNNEIRSSTGATLGAYAVGVLSNSAGNVNLTISNNHFYQTQPLAVAQTAISITTASSGHTISNNFIGGSTVNAGGAAWQNNGNVAFNGIVLPTGTASLNTVTGNTIRNISLTGTGASTFTGINAGNGLFEITNNTIGNPSNANDIAVSGTGVSTGIVVASTNTTSVTGNTIANLTASGTGTGVRVIGINTSAAGNYTIEQNTVSNLTSATTNAGTNANAAIIGILNTATGTGTIIVGRNAISGLTSTAPSAAVSVIGIVNSTGANGSTVTRNFVHSFSAQSATSRQTGILALNGLIFTNNMIRLGIDVNGNSQTVPSTIVGIEKSSTNFITFYHNSVYIGGTNVAAGSNHTFAFLRSGSPSSGNDNIRNNIFVNERSNAVSGSNRHFAMVTNNTSNLIVDYNIYYNGNGIDAVFGSNDGGSTVRNGLPLWFIGNGPHSDAHSGIGNPNFVAPTAATPNLRLNADTPAEGTGVLIAGVIVDFDGDDRSTNTPTDIGADAGNFNSPLVPGTDIFAPVLSFTPIPNQLGCSGPFTAPILEANITDVGVGVPTTGSNVPRLWYRRSAPAPSAWASVPGTLISGNGNNGNWEFQVDYSLIPVTPTAGDIYQYYVAAQDLAVNNGNPNIGFSPFNSNSEPVHTNNNVNTQAVAPTAPTVFVLSNPLDGTVYVGTGPGTPAYPTFNGPGGLFEAINQNGIDGDLIVIVQNTNITEPTGAPTPLNEIAECPGGPYTITIRPGSATDHVITGNISGPGMISLNGADRIIIDGSIAGSGRWLTFVNTNTSSAVVHMANHATSNQVRNSVLRATNTSNTSGIVHIGGANTTGPGNSNLIFHDNAIGGTGQSRNCMLFDGTAIAPNADITISDNHIFNYGSASYSQGISNVGASGDNWTITGNSIYHTINPSVLLVAIYFPLVNGIPINNLNISNNFIGGNAPGATGMMTNSVNSTEAYGIFVSAGTTIINNNVIRNMTYSNVSNSAFVCIDIAGNTQATVSGNTLDEITVLGNVAQQGYIFGIRSSTSASLNASNNNIEYLSCLGASTLGNGSYVRGIEHTGSGTFNISNNYFLGLQNTAIAFGQSSFAIRVSNNSLPSLVSGNTIADNTIYGPWILAIGTSNTGGYRNRGISVSGNFSATISKNSIFDMYTESPVYGTIGIELLNNDVGTITVSNNQIAFGDYTVVSGPSSNNHIRGVKYGIEERMLAGSTLNLFYNSVHIEGAENQASGSAAFRRLATVSGATLNARNNIFINSRSGGTGLHNAVAAEGSAADSGWDSDHNFMASRSFNNVGNWLGIEYSFAGWQANSGSDDNSTSAVSVLTGNSSPSTVRASELFISKGNNLLLAGPGPADPFPHSFIAGLGTPVSITDDFTGASRSLLSPPSGPTMGVNEIVICSGSPPVANVNASNNNLCEIDDATLTLTGLGLVVGLTYQWYESTTSNTGPWNLISGATNINYQANGVNQTTWYYSEVTCTNSGQTTPSTVLELTVIPNNLIATINGSNSVNICSGETVNLEASGANAYNWSSNPIGFTSNNASATANPTETTIYTVVGSISGCDFTESVTATVFSVTLDPISTTINLGDDVTITATPSGNTGSVEYLWTPCINLDSYSGNTVVADPQGSRVYSVFAYDEAGCTATATTTVNVFDPSVVPPPPSTVSAGYSGSNLVSTYSTVVGASGTTLIASGDIDDVNYTNIDFPAGFSFQFVGNTYTSFGINSNGFIWFGSGTPATNAATPISTNGNLGGSGTIDGVISGLGTDLWSKTVLISAPATAQIVTNVSGTAPNRIVTIEWVGFTQKPLSRTSTFLGSDRSRIDFQIRLHENGGTNSNMIDFRYRNQSSWAIFDYMENMQIGLRGATNSDFVNRTANAGAWPSSAAGTANTSVCNMTDPLGFGTYINNNTTAFRFSPTSCVIVTTLTPSGPTDLCSSATVDLTSAPGSSYTWYKDGVLLVGETSQTLSNVAADGLYMAIPIIGSCQAPSYLIEVKNHANAFPDVNIASIPAMPLCNVNEATFNAIPTNGGCSPIYQWKKNGMDVGLPSSNYFDDNLVNGDQIEVEMISSAFCATPSTVQSLIFTVAIQQPGVWLGNGTDWDTPANWGCGIVPNITSDVIIPTNPQMGNVFPEVSSNNTSLVRNLVIQNAASVIVNAGADLSIYGNFTNNGIASLGAGTVRLRANATQVLDGATISTFGNLTVDNTAPVDPAVRLDNDVNISGNLTFVQGKLNLNGNDIDLLGTGQLVNESNNHRVYGFPGEIKTFVDMAANTNYTDIGGMGVSIQTGATAPGITSVERGHQQFTHAGSYQSIRRYFDISPSVNTGLDAILRIFYFDDEMQVDVGFPAHVKANLLPWRSTDNGITWEGQFQPANLSNDVINNWVQLSGIPAFSRWTLSDWIDNPLPVQLLSFDAVANYNNQTVDLRWITASEINNAFFTVERSANAQQFQPILTRPGAGNSNTVITYTDVDMNPLMGVSYYRLKQTDFDGTSTYSEIVPVMFSADMAESVTAFVSDRTGINIFYNSNASGPFVVRLIDSKGAIIGNYQFNAHKGQNTFRIDGLNLASGIYMLNMTNGRAQFSNKLFMR